MSMKMMYEENAMKHPLSIAKVFSDKKQEIFLGVLALAAALVIALVSPSANAAHGDQNHPGASICQAQEEILPPFELKSQKLGH